MDSSHQDVESDMFYLRDWYIVARDGNVSNNIIFVWKSHYIDSSHVLKKRGCDDSPENITTEEMLDNHLSFVFL